jgi:hypothetical protein
VDITLRLMLVFAHGMAVRVVAEKLAQIVVVGSTINCALASNKAVGKTPQ